MKKRSVYIVAGQTRNAVNTRVKRLHSLKDHYEKMVLVCPEKNKQNLTPFDIRPHPNPTGILRVLGLSKIKQKIDRWLYFPSPIFLFSAAARKILTESIESDLKQNLDVTLITTVPPHGLCILGLQLKKKFPSIRWIIDWRDLWSLDKNYVSRTPKWQQQKLLKTESEALTQADINITTNEYAKTYLETQLMASPSRTMAITHPFHNEDLSERGHEKIKIEKTTPETITIGFLGNLFKAPKVPGEKVLDAIAYSKEKGSNIELHICGSLPEKVTENIEIYRKKYGLKFHGSFKHTTSLAIIAQCDFMLLVIEDLPVSQTIVHAKLPHYLLTGKPILAIAPSRSAIADIIEKTGSGYLIKAEEHWGEQLQDILQQYQNGTPLPERDESVIQNYSWDHIKTQWLKAIG